MRLNVKVIFPIDEPEKFRIETDVRDDKVAELIGEFLRGQIGAGADDSPAAELDTYTIHIQLDMSCDRWFCRHDCGNLGLRDGILMDVARRLRGAA